MGVAPGIGAGGSVEIIPALAYVNKITSTSDLSTYSLALPANAFGVADADRWIIIGIATNTGSNGARAETGVTTPTSVTIAGIAADRLSSGEHAQVLGGVAQGVSIWAAKVPTGTTGTVVANFSQAMRRIGFYAYRMIRETDDILNKGFDRVLGGSACVVTAPSPITSFGVIIAHQGDSGTIASLTMTGTGVTLHTTDIIESGSGFYAGSFTPNVGNITIDSNNDAGHVSCWATF